MNARALHTSSVSKQIGLGCMRLSTDPNRDETRAVSVIRAALEVGVSWLDTADAYALDDADVGHNERLIARALEGRDRSAVTVVTKGGLTRPGGQWIANGRAKHLRAACEKSARALGVDQLPLYLLHAPDPEVAIETSVRALAKLKDEGLVRAIGLSNVGVDQLERARAIADIEAVEVSLGVFAEDSLAGGVAEYCLSRGIRLIAHSPLGGPRKKSALEKHRVLARIGAKHGVTPAIIALAWLFDLSPAIVPIPGATRVETARSLARASSVEFDETDRAALQEAFPLGRLLRVPRSLRRPAVANGEVVVLMGIQAAGKSSAVSAYVERGHVRLNRDELGGRMTSLHKKLDELLASGKPRVVLDNTYATRASRSEVIETAWKRGAHVRCVWIDTPIEEAQINAVLRMLDRHGVLLGPAEIKQASKRDPNIFGPDVQFRFARMFEPPALDEGFEAIERVPFSRTWPPGQGRALFVELDGVLRASRSGKRAPLSVDDLLVSTDRAAVLRRFADDGFVLIGMAWLPEIGAGVLTAADAVEVHRAFEAQLGVSMRFVFCPHGAGPVACWCRRPLPGLGVMEIRALGLDPRACVVAGRAPADRTFAERLGFRFEDAEQFFLTASGRDS